ncbi:hypothetical protein GCK32_014833, partial [Trichostrongylus colubriformis]
PGTIKTAETFELGRNSEELIIFASDNKGQGKKAPHRNQSPGEDFEPHEKAKKSAKEKAKRDAQQSKNE